MRVKLQNIIAVPLTIGILGLAYGSLSKGASRVEMRDCNKDGVKDIVVSTYTGGKKVFYGNNAGTNTVYESDAQKAWSGVEDWRKEHFGLSK